MVKRHIETWFDIGVALKAEGRLTHLEHGSFRGSLMHGVTSDAAHIGLGMRGAEEVWMRPSVTAKAGCVYGLRVGSREIEDFCLISARLNVCFSWSVAALAGDTLAAMLQRELGMRV